METAMKISDVADMTGLSVSHIYRLTSKQEIPHYKINSAVRFRRSDIEKWLEQKRVYTRKEATEIVAARLG